MRIKNIIGLFIGFLITSHSAAKNNGSSRLIEKKDEIAANISSKMKGSDVLFERNNGQYDANFSFRFSSQTACVDFYDQKVTFSLRTVKRAFNPRKAEEPIQFEYVTWQIGLNANSGSKLVADAPLQQSNVNYFGANGDKIAKELVERIVYKEIYPNIDLVFYKSKKSELKYDFVLHPGARLSDIKLDYEGVENLRLDKSNNLLYDTPWGAIKEEVPYSYIKATNDEVAIDYVVTDNVLSFSALFNEVMEETILDPVYVDWSSYFYGSGQTTTGFGYGYTWVYDLDIDDDDNLYVTGLTNDKFPSTVGSYDTAANGYYDAFVCKMTPGGDSIIWFSYLGGDNYEYCFSLAVNSSQEPVVSGFTRSTDFPITANAFDQTSNLGTSGGYYAGYVTKFSKNGDSLLFSTYLSGSGSELIQSIVLDESDNIYLTGQTSSSDFFTTAGAYQTTYGGGAGSWWNSGDAFLTKMAPDGSSLVFSTFFGGNGDDVAYQVQVSPNNDIYIVGKTTSSSFPVTPGSQIFNPTVQGASDGFVAKFNSTGTTLMYSKLMGGSGEDWFEGVYVNERDEAYVAGISQSSDFFTSSNAYQKNSSGGADAVVVKFNPGGQNVYYSTYLGGSGDEMYYSGWIYNSNVRIAANVREEAIVCGITRSNNFPITSDALMKSNPSSQGGGWWNTAATITKLSFSGDKLLYGTYYGGSSYEVPGANKLKRISCFTNVLYGGFTASSDYPTTKGVFRENKSNSSTGYFWTGFISKFRDTLYTDEIELSLSDTVLKCDRVFDILNAKNLGADILWSTGNTTRYQTIQDTGTYWVQATYGCDTARDTIHYVLEYSPKLPVLPEDSIYCNSFPNIPLNASVDSVLATYKWSSGATDSAITVAQPGKYWVDVITPNCGTMRDEVIFDLKQTPEATLEDSTFCDDIDILLQVGDSAANEETFVWNTGDSTSSMLVSDTGFYKVVISNFCGVDSAEATIDILYTPEVTLPVDSEFCNTVSYTLHYGKEDNEEDYKVEDQATGAYFLTPDDSANLTKVGAYIISAENKCGLSADTIVLTKIETPTLNFNVDSILCDQVSYPLEIGKVNNKEEYVWDNNSTSKQRTITASGEYWAQIRNKCGTARDSFEVDFIESPLVSLPADSVFCDAISWELEAGAPDEYIYLWSDGSGANILQVDAAGTYTVEVSNACGTVTDNVNVDILFSPKVDLGNDEIFCDGVDLRTFTVGRVDNAESYLWSTGSVANEETFSNEGKHWVRIDNKCTFASDTVAFIISESPVVTLPPDTTLCGNFSLTLDAGNSGMQYVWEPTGETTQTIQATEQTTYTVTVFNENGCFGEGSMTVKPDCVSKSFIPDAFSPNNDGTNDVFRPTLINFESYTLDIYNRWGERIFSSTNVADGWDGTYKGVKVPQGVYTYVMRYKTTEDLKWQNVGGVIHLVR